MNLQRKQLVTPLLILGVLGMIVAVLAFAEKTREDGHLPERNGRGSGEIITPAAAPGPAGTLALEFRMPESAGGTCSEHPVLPLSGGMR